MFHSKGIRVTPDQLVSQHSERPGEESIHEDVSTTRRTVGTREAASRTDVTIKTAGLIISVS